MRKTFAIVMMTASALLLTSCNDLNWWGERTQYFKDYRTNVCFATWEGQSGATYVPCTPEVERMVARPRR